jgi:hypothetical protein
MTRNAVSAPDYFLMPSARVVELGTLVEMYQREKVTSCISKMVG